MTPVLTFVRLRVIRSAHLYIEMQCPCYTVPAQHPSPKREHSATKCQHAKQIGRVTDSGSNVPSSRRKHSARIVPVI